MREDATGAPEKSSLLWFQRSARSVPGPARRRRVCPGTVTAQPTRGEGRRGTCSSPPTPCGGVGGSGHSRRTIVGERAEREGVALRGAHGQRVRLTGSTVRGCILFGSTSHHMRIFRRMFRIRSVSGCRRYCVRVRGRRSLLVGPKILRRIPNAQASPKPRVSAENVLGSGVLYWN
jgi:hypothetical protein